MSVKTLDREESLGIFELDDNGTVIYSSFEESNTWLGAEKDIKGRESQRSEVRDQKSAKFSDY